MQEILYLEIPTPHTSQVIQWLQQHWQPSHGEIRPSSDGVQWYAARPDSIAPQLDSVNSMASVNSVSSVDSVATLEPDPVAPSPLGEINIFLWSLQRTTYLKAFRYQAQPIPQESVLLAQLQQQLRIEFPPQYPEPPSIDPQVSIFTALEPHYPQTVKFFKKIPRGEADLNRVYWWEQRWREGVRNPQTPKQVLFADPVKSNPSNPESPTYDLVYLGGALGVIHAAVMARLGYKVLLVERLGFGRMNREWNISRDEFQSLIDLGLFTPSQFTSVIAKEYLDGFNKFFDANNPPNLQSPILHTPKVLNICIDAEKLLQLCGEKLRAAGGEIWDQTEFISANIAVDRATLNLTHLPTKTQKTVTTRLIVDAMGTASPIAWQLNGGRAFDSVCPTVGGVVSKGFDPEVWDLDYGDVLNSHGDISRGRQLIWELFPGANGEITIYLFHYHQVNATNPGSLLEMYEDFFTILPEYRRCDMEKLEWRKATFGYIPGHFSVGSRDRTVAFDRLITIGDAASLQSPLVFTGFGSLVRNLGRLTHLLDTALKHDLLKAENLNQIRAYQSNTAVTWLFSKGMMVPTGVSLPPQRINSMLNTFFGILADEPSAIADTFIKDRTNWLTFNRLALKAAIRNPGLLIWIWQLAGFKDIFRWLGSYVDFTLTAFVSWLMAGWVPQLFQKYQSWLESKFPALWLRCLAQTYAWTHGLGKNQGSKTTEKILKPPMKNSLPVDRPLVAPIPPQKTNN